MKRELDAPVAVRSSRPTVTLPAPPRAAAGENRSASGEPPASRRGGRARSGPPGSAPFRAGCDERRRARPPGRRAMPRRTRAPAPLLGRRRPAAGHPGSSRGQSPPGRAEPPSLAPRPRAGRRPPSSRRGRGRPARGASGVPRPAAPAAGDPRRSRSRWQSNPANWPEAAFPEGKSPASGTPLPASPTVSRPPSLRRMSRRRPGPPGPAAGRASRPPGRRASGRSRCGHRWNPVGPGRRRNPADPGIGCAGAPDRRRPRSRDRFGVEVGRVQRRAWRRSS